jgi:hypothetical protein
MPPTLWLSNMDIMTSSTEHWGSRSEEPDETNDALATAVIVVVLFEQLILPLIICIVLWISRCCNKIPQTEAYQEVSTRFLDELSQFDKRYPIQTPDHYSPQMLSEIADIEKRLSSAVHSLIAQRQMHKAASKKRVSFGRVLSFHSYVSFIIWTLYVPVAFLVHPKQNFGLMRGMGLFALFYMVVNYVAVLVESCMCAERKYIANLSSVASAAERIDQIKNVQPYVSFSAECYHFELRTKTLVFPDLEGNVSTAEVICNEKVVTARINEPFIFRFWQDHSQAALINIHKKKIMKIKMELQILLGDVETAKDFDERYFKFKEENKNRDLFVNFSVSRTVTGFSKRIAAYVDANAEVWWIKSWCFWLSTLLCLGWIYRLVFKYSTEKTTYAVTKFVYVNRPVAQSVDNQDFAAKEVEHHHGIEQRNTVGNGHVEEPNSSQLDDSFQCTKRKIEANLKMLETSGVDEESMPLRLVSDTDFMHVTMVDQSQLREAQFAISP